MGIILSRFRVKKTTIEILEDLESKIKEIQEYGQNTEQKHKKIVGTLVIYSVVLYITTAFIFYFYFFPASLYDQIFYITPLLIFPIIILFTKKMVSCYYKCKISRNQEKLITMQQEKSKILDEVTETETYKKAKEILLRFAPDQLKMTSTSVKVPQTVEKLRQPNVPHIIASSSPGIGEIRRRTVGNPNQSPNVSRDNNARSLPVDGTPNKSTQLNTPIQTGSRMLSNTSMGYRTPEYTLARPVLPHHRSNFDRLIDYLVGDGPSNRYALICRQCECHNGMALKEEFEYLGFRCCYCNFWNPPRKQKPGVQRIEDVSSNTSPTSGTLANDSSDKIMKTSKLPEVEASYSSDTDSDIELVERPAEISENQEHIDDNYTDSNINEKGMQSSEDKKSSEEMEVED
nr:endoplasmic reticulum junction formation protein lunapark-B [Vespula vulgaris]